MIPPQELDHAGLAALIPHSGPMCLLNRLRAWDEERIECSASNHRDAAHPLRTRSGLLCSCAIEYAAQAMALHGALLGQAGGTRASPGYLASARGVTLHRWRLDDLPVPQDAADVLLVQATRVAGDARQILYAFTLMHAGLCLAEGRAAVVLNPNAPL